MPIAERILLIVKRTAGIGHGRAIVDRLRTMLGELSGEGATLQVDVVGDHPTARARANEFLTASDAPAVVIVGGGSGTLRAGIVGLCEGSAAGAFDAAKGAFLASSPWLFGFASGGTRYWLPHALMGAADIMAAITTRTD